MHPTAEQEHAIGLFRTGRGLKVNAFAGAGKTKTLELMAQERGRQKGLYLAFNKSIADEARSRLPGLKCSTTMSLAWHDLIGRYDASRMTSAVKPVWLRQQRDYQGTVFGADLPLDGAQLAFLVANTLRAFCLSADAQIAPKHMPRHGALRDMPDDVVEEVEAWAVKEAEQVWRLMISTSGDFRLGFDGYFKLWALEEPTIPYDFILLDEAQDTNAALLGVLKKQASQLVVVGDRHQQIYEWRGAVNAMEQFDDLAEARLTQSFRFGHEIAGLASQVLTHLGEAHQVRGNPAAASRRSRTPASRAVLARTNAQVFQEIMAAQERGLRVHLAGNVEELRQLAIAVDHLKRGRKTTYPDLYGFQDWEEVVSFAEREEGKDLASLVQLVERHGVVGLKKAAEFGVASIGEADLSISTVHKAKGQEWDAVVLAADFRPSCLPRMRSDAEALARLFYVGLTRARNARSSRKLSNSIRLALGFQTWSMRRPSRLLSKPSPPPLQRNDCSIRSSTEMQPKMWSRRAELHQQRRTRTQSFPRPLRPSDPFAERKWPLWSNGQWRDAALANCLVPLVPPLLDCVLNGQTETLTHYPRIPSQQQGEGGQGADQAGRSRRLRTISGHSRFFIKRTLVPGPLRRSRSPPHVGS